MKSRSQRLPTSVDPHDDWVEESWTVDCVCGVNFDDGEEMVNCDECGVWVHTRCSRYVKSEKSFACHKCKNKNIVRNDSEETEVAQLLVELPTKTLRLDNPPPPPLPPPSSYKASPFPPPARKAFRLWTDIPIEDRVHVQGVPGGDPSLFSGFSSIFGPQLWKCSGYVPKKFNFRYSEFPCWDKEEVLEKDLEKKSGGESEINADNGGAGALFYLSNENSLPAPAVDSVSVESQAVDCNSERVVSQKETNKSEVENSDVPRPKNEVKKDKSLLQPSVIHFAKHKEDMGMSNDKSAKKKARIIEKEGDFKKKCLYTSGTASTKSSDVKQIQFSEDRGLKVVQVNSQNSKNGNSSHCLTLGQLPCDPGMVDYVIDAQKNNLASGENDSENSSFDASGHNTLSSATPKEENGGHRVPVKLEDSSKTVDGAVPLLGQNDSWGVPIKEEVHIGTDVSPNEFGGELTTRLEMDVLKSEPVPEDVGTAQPETEDNENAPDSSIDMVASCSDLHAQAKMELADNHSNHVQPPLLHDAKLGVLGTSVQSQEKSAHSLSENVKDCETTVNVLETNNSKVEDAVRRLEVFDIQKDGVDGESPLDQSQPNHACAGLDGSLEAKKVSAGSGSNSFVESSKSSVAVLNPPVDSDEGKVIACLVSSSLTSSALVMCKPSASEYHINASSQGHNMDSKQKGMPESSLAGNQDNAGASNESVKDDRRHEQAKKLVKEIPKSSLSSVAKSTQLKKYSHAIVSKRTSPDSKDTVLHSSSLSPVPHIGSSPGSDQANVQQTESVPNIQKKASALQTETASSFQKKVTGSVLSQKGEKTNQSVGQSSSKVNTTLTHAATSSNSPATLSDEELALLLHQELNSSPRVPRVPRMRHAGSLPQLTSPTATSMLMKRTFSTGGKDHGLTSRRKDKDSVKDGSHGSREMDNKAKKVETVPASCDLGRQDSAFASNSVSKREADSGSANGVYSRKKSNGPVGATSSGGLSSPADGNENSFSSTRHSSRIPSDDEKRVVGRLTHRTLPGLIAEIMSKGKRMTYEELCNAVLLHWPNLRKHNGERYAYTSHSQAVLDCLRNRNEWARLVDRGPKTSGGRKRRKLESDPAGVDSEDNDDSRDQTATDMRSKTVESQHEEFPKGKRNARKRRRLALQGRGIKDVRRRRRTDELGDDEVGSFSDSSEETMFSEDEIQGCGNSAAGNEVSLSSDGTSNI